MLLNTCMAYSGKYNPTYPNKYKGDPTNIIYRSLWERKLMKYLDNHPDVLEWASEEFCIPYRSPLDGKMHRYFPDFYVKKRGVGGTIDELVIEVKPSKHLKEPPAPKRKTRRYFGEMARYAVNQRKFEVAEQFCHARGLKFIIMTEKELDIKW